MIHGQQYGVAALVAVETIGQVIKACGRGKTRTCVSEFQGDVNERKLTQNGGTQPIG
jgi:hypothetical protein